jgi:serine/threonine protein kinase
VFFEMLTGRQSFQGKTVSDVLASILAREADLSLLPARLNPRIPHFLSRAIEKEPRQRWQAVGDMRVELEAIAVEGAVLVQADRALVPKPLWRRLIPVIITGVLIGALTAFTVWNLKPLPAAKITRSVFTLPDDQQFTNPGRLLLAISPDGSRWFTLQTGDYICGECMNSNRVPFPERKYMTKAELTIHLSLQTETRWCFGRGWTGRSSELP